MYITTKSETQPKFLIICSSFLRCQSLNNKLGPDLLYSISWCKCSFHGQSLHTKMPLKEKWRIGMPWQNIPCAAFSPCRQELCETIREHTCTRVQCSKTSKILLKITFIYFACISLHATVNMWHLENNLSKSFSSFYHIYLGLNTHCQAWWRALLPAQLSYWPQLRSFNSFKLLLESKLL